MTNKFFEMCQILDLGTATTNQNCIHKEPKSITLPVLYGCGTWSLVVREEHGLRVFENGVLRREYLDKEREVTEVWRKLRDEELHNLLDIHQVLLG
jgi:hypothetical protein